MGSLWDGVNAQRVPRPSAVKHASASVSAPRDVGAAAERPSTGGRRAISARTEERHPSPPRVRAQNLSAVPRTRAVVLRAACMRGQRACGWILPTCPGLAGRLMPLSPFEFEREGSVDRVGASLAVRDRESGAIIRVTASFKAPRSGIRRRQAVFRRSSIRSMMEILILERLPATRRGSL